MIHSVQSNNSNFKPVYFNNGFNVVMADRKRDNETDGKRTRNGAGKTTLIEIIHFCLGAQVNKNSIFKNDNLKGWSFILEIDIRDHKCCIERFTDCVNKIFIDHGSLDIFTQYKYDSQLHRYYVSTVAFNKILLKEFYGIDAISGEQCYTPSFRELISYAIRRNVEGYKNAFEFFSHQKAYSVQICNSFFLNLSLEYAAQFQVLKDKQKGIENYKKAINTGIVGPVNLNIGELNTEVINCQSDVTLLEEQLESFQIHPQYNEISEKVNLLTKQIHEYTNTRIFRQRLLEKYESSYEDNNLILPVNDVENIYYEVGVLFPDVMRRELSEVINFHKEIVSNRKEYLINEIESLKSEISYIENKIKDMSCQRAELMKILETHGALDEYIIIQNHYVVARQRLEDAKEKLESSKYIENSKSRLKIENQELLLKTRQDYYERKSNLEKAISLFKKNTGILYPEPGTLTIDLNESGYSFGVDIKNSRSQGVNYMKVFCYDMVITELGKNREKYPDFLIHDSTIFDGVDERQVAKALMLAANKCDQLGVQYICLINSDMVPYQEFDSDFTSLFNDSIRIRISDNQVDGGLLGIRF